MIIPERNFSNLKEFEKLVFDLKEKRNLSVEYYNAYLKNFHQPKVISIEEGYVRQIKEKI